MIAVYEGNTESSFKQMRDTTKEAAARIEIIHAKSICFTSSIPPSHGDSLSFQYLTYSFQTKKKHLCKYHCLWKVFY